MCGRRNLTKAVALCAMAAALCSVASGRILYVDDSAGAPNHGNSWTDALLYLQDALILAELVQEPVEIRVAQGIYKPDEGTGITPGDREVSFKIPRDAVLRGGYAGIEAADPNERNVALYETILTGDLLEDDPDIADAQVLVNAPSRLDNSLHVVTMNQADSCVMDGFTIHAGHAVVAAGPRGGTSDGGGMRIEDSNATLCNCTFIHNWGSEGGAVFVSCNGFDMVSRLEIRNCRFLANASRHYGGALAIREGELLLTDCEFSGNASARGGGLSCRLSDLSLSRCTFRENRAVDGSGLHHVSGNLSLAGCTFENNSTLPPGVSRGPVTRAGAVFIDNSSGKQAVATDCLFKNNRGFSGAAIQGALTTLRDCRFTGNTAYTRAGAIDGRGPLTCENCLFEGNKALEGTAVARCFGSLLFANCTFVENQSPDGYAFSATGGHGSPVDQIFRNCILWGAGQGIEFADSQPEYVSLTYSAVQGGWPGTGNIDAAPRFAEAGFWDPNGTPDDPEDDVWVAGDYHLKSQAGRWDPMSETWAIDDVTCPCIDAGNPNSFLGDELFPNGGRINIGAYGGTTEASKSYFGGPVCQKHRAGDINGDCKVDFDDLLIVISQWTAELPPEIPAGPLPGVVIVEPSDGATLEIRNSPVLIRAEADDLEGRIIAVTFEISHAEQGFSYTGLYPGRMGEHGWYLEWDWTSPEYRLPEGRYTIIAKATDGEGATTTSSAVTITIVEAPHGPRR